MSALYKGSRLRLLPNLLAMIVAVLLVLAVGASAALAAAPWWHLTSGSRPAFLQPGGEGADFVNEVREISVTALRWGISCL